MARVAAFAGHGGRRAQAAALFPRAPQPWLDLSTGVNPDPYPFAGATPAARARLPDPEEVAELERVAAAAFGVAPERVCATPGAEAGARLLAEALGAGSAGIVQPTYNGHAQAWQAAGRDVLALSRGDLDSLDAGARRPEAIVLVNPNNPDGAIAPPRVLVALAERLAPRRGWLIVDEAFVDATPNLSVSRERCGALVVLRSFGKFYGLAGVRLGFVIGDPELIDRLRRRQGSWPVSADALAAGLQAYADAQWATQTRARLVRDAARLDALLSRAGLAAVSGTALFRLVRAADAAHRFVRLAERGVLARPFAYAPDWLRFGLPPADAWDRLEAALMQTAPTETRP